MDDNYDEFGNYIGPDIDQTSEDVQIEEEPNEDNNNNQGGQMAIVPSQMSQIVLNEDKQYYPEAEQAYGKGVEINVQEEDAQPITQPIIAPIRSRDFDLLESDIPDTTFDYKFLCSIFKNPALVRNVTVAGALHHGKTTFMDLLYKQTHIKRYDLNKDIKYTDTRKDEQDRMISIKSSPMSLVLPSTKDKSYLFNLMDTPGHVSYQDEVSCGMRASDGVLLVIDAVEGVMMTTERIIQASIKEHIPIVVLINKIDRLIIELKLPPNDAYLKLRHILEEVNGIIAQFGGEQKVSPQLGNVVFGSGYYQFVFSIETFATRYTDMVDPRSLHKVLWGDYYYDHQTKKFSRNGNNKKRAFVEFVLEPIYKIFAQVASKDRDELEPFLLSIGVALKKSEYRMDTKPLIKLVCGFYFGNCSALVDQLVQHVPNSQVGNKQKVEQHYQGDREGEFYNSITKCEHTGPLVVNIVKMYHKPDCMSFDALGRVISGTLTRNCTVKVLGEKYNPEDEEDMSIRAIKNIWIYQGRYRVEVTQVPAGNWVLIEGIDQSISKSATIVDYDAQSADIFKPIDYNIMATMKIAIEPLVPSELPKMLEGLRKVIKSYPVLTTKVEESGEHILLGTGELQLDCVMHDLRKMYSEIEIKVSDPSVRFCETVIDTSSKKCYAETPNKKNKITMIAQPLDKGLAAAIENDKVHLNWEPKVISSYFQKEYNWDILQSRSIWSFGPDKQGPNILIDDTLPSETNKVLLSSIKDSIVQGFQWATREGPLCDEPIRNVKFKLIEANIAQEPIYRGGGQIIPTSRRTCYSSFLMATPRIMEPMLLCEILCTQDCLEAIYNVIQRRRGHILLESAKPGTTFYVVKAHIPTIDHFGFETDLRVHTQGQAYCLSVFDHWSMLPGDPLDKTIQLKPLEPAPAPHLAREFMVKTRRRKGLNEDVSILKFFDDPMLIEALKQDKEYQKFI